MQHLMEGCAVVLRDECAPDGGHVLAGRLRSDGVVLILPQQHKPGVHPLVHAIQSASDCQLGLRNF